MTAPCRLYSLINFDIFPGGFRGGTPKPLTLGKLVPIALLYKYKREVPLPWLEPINR